MTAPLFIQPKPNLGHRNESVLKITVQIFSIHFLFLRNYELSSTREFYGTIHLQIPRKRKSIAPGDKLGGKVWRIEETEPFEKR